MHSLISERLKNQDNRATASPYLYVLQEQKRVYADEFDNSDGVEYYDDHTCSSFDTIEEAREYFEENEFEDVDDKVNNLRKSEYKFYWEDVNWFFSKEALDNHVRGNKHRYGKTRDYVKHCFRNPEMEYVQKVLTDNLIGKLKEEIEVLRQYGNKDCIAMADEELLGEEVFQGLKDLFCKEDDNKKQWDALKKDLVGFSELVKAKQARDNALILAAVEALELIKTKHVSCDCMDTAAIADEALEKIYGAIPEIRRKPL